MKASFLISELGEVEKSLAVGMFWLSAEFQQNCPAPIFGVSVTVGMERNLFFQKWDYVYPSTETYCECKNTAPSLIEVVQMR